MTPYYQDDSVTIYHGDCREILPSIKDVTAVITDPPYGLEFMSKEWDHNVPGQYFWEVIALACLPGAPLLAFGGTRTHHRLMVAIEDAGFVIRDMLMWVYGNGFPKSLDIGKAIDKAKGKENVIGYKPDRWTGKGNSLNFSSDRPQAQVKVTSLVTDEAQQWDGWGTTLKPAYEPIILAMKPLQGTFAENVLKWGVGGLNIDGSRIEYVSTADKESSTPQGKATSKQGRIGARPDVGNDEERTEFERPELKGRWPANLLLDESEEVLNMFPLSEISGSAKNGRPALGEHYDLTSNVYGDGLGNTQGRLHNDAGSASRFFYTAKASNAERNDGNHVDNTHPTVKPLALIHYLLTLVTMPKANLILDPFMGSGTTLRAAKDLGRKAIGIEIEERYCEIAAKRMSQSAMELSI